MKLVTGDTQRACVAVVSEDETAVRWRTNPCRPMDYHRPRRVVGLYAQAYRIPAVWYFIQSTERQCSGAIPRKQTKSLRPPDKTSYALSRRTVRIPSRCWRWGMPTGTSAAMLAATGNRISLHTEEEASCWSWIKLQLKYRHVVASIYRASRDTRVTSHVNRPKSRTSVTN